MIKRKKYDEAKKKTGESRALDKKLVQMQARLCDPSLTREQRRMILQEAGKWRR